MCLTLYIASDVPLPVVGSPDEPGSVFHASLPVEKYCREVRKVLSKPYMMFLGSFQGCSCGFAYDPSEYSSNSLVDEADSMPRISIETLKEWDQNEREDQAMRVASARELAAYVSEAVRHSDIEIAIAWHEQFTDTVFRRQVSLDYFTSYEQGLDLPENCLFEIQRVGHEQRPDEVSKA